ncbi:unnamed protein product [Penicillium pancosmium]
MEPNTPQDPYAYENMASPSPGPHKAKKKRVRKWTAEDRAVHREFEKSRREAFSERLMELTDLLPMLRAEQRPSKHVIVDASISYHKTQEARYHQAVCAIQDLLSERDELLREVNSLRPLCQSSGWVPRQPRVDPAVVAMLSDQGPAVSTSEQTEIAPNDTVLQINPSIAASGVATLSGLPHLPQPTYNADDWSWSSAPNSASFSPDAIVDHPVIWNTPPGMVTATPPKDGELGYDPSTSYLISDSALFWTQHPSLNTTTPPRDGDLQYGTNATAVLEEMPSIWPQRMAISTTNPSGSEEARSNNQNFQSINSFSNPASLSI